MGVSVLMSCCRLFEMLIVLPVGPASAPDPSVAFELTHNESVFQNRAGKRFGPVQIPAAGRRKNFASFDIRIRQRIDIDGAPPTVIGKNSWFSRCIAAI